MHLNPGSYQDRSVSLQVLDHSGSSCGEGKLQLLVDRRVYFFRKFMPPSRTAGCKKAKVERNWVTTLYYSIDSQLARFYFVDNNYVT